MISPHQFFRSFVVSYKMSNEQCRQLNMDIIGARKANSRMVRVFALCGTMFLAATACTRDAPSAPRSMPVPAFSSQTVAVGDQILLWDTYYFPPDASFDLVVMGNSEAAPSVDCSPGSGYIIRAVSPQGAQTGAGIQFWSREALAPGTKLRFIGYVTNCLEWNAHVFEVIRVPGR